MKMKYKDTGFRAFYRHFIAVPMKENLKVVDSGEGRKYFIDPYVLDGTQ